MRTAPVAAALLLTALCGTAAAQTPFVPYFGKNNIRYDNFQWSIYTTDRYEFYYYPEVEQHLERVVSYAESAYQHVSSELHHDLSFKVQMILYKTHSEFEQQNVIPGAAQEGVGAFAEPFRQRIVLPLDDPPDRLYGLIVHELTHQFEFDMIPQSLIRQTVPLWVNEGLADYMRGAWTPLDLMMVRDAAVADVVPKMTELEGYGGGNSPRLIYNLGHALFEFIEAKWGKEGIRGFIFALRKSVIGGGEDAYEEAFRMKPAEFDQAFDRYLKDRFRPFRDKERPADYGMDLAPDAEKTEFMQALSIAPSPSGDLIAIVTINRKDREYDILLVSSKDGTKFKTLTEGFDKDMGFSHLAIPGERYTTVHWLSWSPKGDRMAYFVRTEKERTLIVQNITNRRIEVRIPMRFVDEPESPSFSPDGSTIAFSALSAGRSDIFTVDLATGQHTNLTDDDFADFAPVFSPDGKYLIYMVRVSGNQKLFRFDLDTKKKTQLTFGTHDDGAAHFIDGNTIAFASTATDPALAIEPDVARNGNIYNIWTLDLGNGELKQYTDALSGNLLPIVLKDGASHRIAFVTYYKDEYGIHTLDRKEPLHTAASADFGAPGQIIDFQAPLSHTLVAENSRRKRTFEKMFLEGRPPVNLGVTSNGDVFGGTAITFGDVLGDQQFNLFASSIAQYRSLALSYTNLARRFQYAVQGFTQTQFFYGALEGVFYDPAFAPLISRDQAVATRTVRGASAFGIYPFDRYRRLELSTAFINLREQYSENGIQDYLNFYGLQPQQVFRSGTLVPFGVAYVQETTVFREFGPLAGNTMRIGYDVAPKIANTLSRQTFDLDARYYQRLATSGVLALRLRGFKSIGDFPDYMYFGGNSEMRGYDYLEFIGQNVVFANAELRFPLIEAALTPIGVIGGIRGVFFANIGGGWFNDQGFEFATNRQERHTPITGYRTDENGTPFIDVDTGLPTPIFGQEQVVSGFRLKDGRASYGIGLETFALGFPIHFDWSWRTLFNRQWEDVLFASAGGSAEFRKPRFAIWIGYDF
jgi:Tol biopolymer transport system component